MDDGPGPYWTCPVCGQITEMKEDSAESKDNYHYSNMFSGFANGEVDLNSPTFNNESIRMLTPWELIGKFEL